MTAFAADAADHDDGNSIGIVGYGLLGAAYARRLADAGLRPYVLDRAPGLVPGGEAAVQHVSTAGGLSRLCSVVIICVYSTAQVSDVLQDLARASPAAAATVHTVLCATTLDPVAVAGLASAANAAGMTFIECPVSGTSAQIRDGEGLGLLSGDATAITAHRTLIEILTPRWHNLGPTGSAARAKLAVNLVLEVNRSALAEGLVLASRLGLEPSAFLAALEDSAAYSRVMDGKAPKMLSGDFSAEGRATQSLKDIEMILAAGAATGQRLPLASAQAAVLRAVVQAGDGELDSSVVYRAIAAMCG